MKCDGRRPACLRCTAGGYKCDGFIYDKLSDPIQRLNAQEQRSFQYFQEQASFELSGFFDMVKKALTPSFVNPP